MVDREVVSQKREGGGCNGKEAVAMETCGGGVMTSNGSMARNKSIGHLGRQHGGDGRHDSISGCLLG